jgi:DNA-binding winged helix-turn-helix (wHTH) protein/tetratricopeptide (TPR) repeat protein
MSPNEPEIFAFEPFVLDRSNRRLTRNGIPVRVNSQILDLLELLLLHAGQLVTREQIRTSLWPDQEFVGHDKIITNAISRLRHILRDNSSAPRYIESVPKQGYRLVAKVTQTRPARPEILAPGPGSSGAAPDLASQRPETALLTLPEFLFDGPRRRRPGQLLRAYLSFGLLIALTLGSWAWRWRAAERAKGISAGISLGIAPFETSGQGAKELGESFRMDLTDSLAQLPHVNVRAAHSLELFSQDEATFRERADKLGLDALILGRFAVNGDQCQLELELVRGKDMVHIATFRHMISRSELASVRDKIQMETFASLKLARPEGGELPQSPVGGTSDPRAYDAYLRAGYHLSQQTKDSIPLAITEYNEAIALDPHFAKAFSGQARAYFYLQQNSLIPELEGFGKASEAAHRALALDPTSAEAHAVLGLGYFLHDWNLAGGEAELQRAIATDPNQPFYHQGLALIFNDEGRAREALAEVDLAHAIDPFWVSAYITEAHVSSIAKDLPRAQASMRKLMELMPDSPHARDAIGNAEWNLGQFTQAIQTWREMAVMEQDKDRIGIEDHGMAAFRAGGEPAYARVRLAAIASGAGVQRHANDFVLSEWYGYAGETEKAVAEIQSRYEHHGSYVAGLAVLPAYAGLRGNPVYESILARLHLRSAFAEKKTTVHPS